MTRNNLTKPQKRLRKLIDFIDKTLTQIDMDIKTTETAKEYEYYFALRDKTYEQFLKEEPKDDFYTWQKDRR